MNALLKDRIPCTATLNTNLGIQARLGVTDSTRRWSIVGIDSQTINPKTEARNTEAIVILDYKFCPSDPDAK